MTAIPTWQSLALCRTEGQLEDFFPETPAMAARAKAVCARCEVAQACLADALARGDRWAVQGGLTADERVALAGRPLRHGERATYTSGCHCLPCRRSNAVYNADLRNRHRWAATATTRPTLVVPIRTLERPAGRGLHRAYAGQLVLDLGVAV